MTNIFKNKLIWIVGVIIVLIGAGIFLSQREQSFYDGMVQQLREKGYEGDIPSPEEFDGLMKEAMTNMIPALESYHDENGIYPTGSDFIELPEYADLYEGAFYPPFGYFQLDSGQDYVMCGNFARKKDNCINAKREWRSGEEVEEKLRREGIL